MLGILSQKSSESNPHHELRGGNGAPIDVGGTLGVALGVETGMSGSS